VRGLPRVSHNGQSVSVRHRTPDWWSVVVAVAAGLGFVVAMVSETPWLGGLSIVVLVAVALYWKWQGHRVAFGRRRP